MVESVEVYEHCGLDERSCSDDHFKGITACRCTLNKGRVNRTGHLLIRCTFTQSFVFHDVENKKCFNGRLPFSHHGFSHEWSGNVYEHTGSSAAERYCHDAHRSDESSPIWSISRRRITRIHRALPQAGSSTQAGCCDRFGLSHRWP